MYFPVLGEQGIDRERKAVEVVTVGFSLFQQLL